MKRRLWLLLPAVLVVVVLLMYPSTQCHVTEAQLTISPLETFVVPVEQGYAVGFSFSVTNGASCEINAKEIHVILRSVAYADGRQVAQNSEGTETKGGTIMPGQSGRFSHTFDSYFIYRPTKLLLRMEMTFAETGPVLVFDGELNVSE